MDINELLKRAHAMGASDLHIKVGSPPIVRLHGELRPMDGIERINLEEALKIAFSVMSPSQRETFKNEHELDFAYSVPGLGRFRCNAFYQRGAVGLVFRVIPMKVPTFEELNLPDVLKKIAMEQRGLILVTGTTGSGKSTTLAAMIDYINANRAVNIITIEDPIEFLHRDKRSIVSQREIGSDTDSFSKALRSALRQDPDVILVGEMRDLETIEIALIAAETGHLVMSTLHTLDAKETVNRIISMFPPHQHQQIRIQLASVIKAVISQRLLPKADGTGRVPAVEVMLGTLTIKECITDPEKTKLIPDVIAQGKLLYGMQTFDQSLFDLYKAGLVTYEEALKWASNPDDFTLKVKGIQTTADVVREGGKPEAPQKPGFKIERFGS
ncbi:MAG: PilT/PilU family type 4a pilus ATPase [Thermodesulfovibrionales bacterium]|nr:PilT/PilU family type 4a pilus ATPase [Thermodesulfovibrionales bacterium]